MSVTDTIKLLKDAIAAKETAEAYRFVSDLQSTLIETQSKLAELQEDARTLKAKLAARESVHFDERFGAYFMGESGDRQGPPHCSRCLDVDGRLVKMLRWPNGHGFECPNCHTKQGDPDNPFPSLPPQTDQYDPLND